MLKVPYKHYDEPDVHFSSDMSHWFAASLNPYFDREQLSHRTEGLQWTWLDVLDVCF